MSHSPQKHKEKWDKRRKIKNTETAGFSGRSVYPNLSLKPRSDHAELRTFSGKNEVSHMTNT